MVAVTSEIAGIQSAATPRTLPTIERIETLSSPGIFDNYRHSADLPRFRQYNLFYGFNGCGKTTVTRVFYSLSTGSMHPRLPAGTQFQIRLTDGQILRSEENITDVLNGRLFVFNVDFIEENLQWTSGRANPIFYIGREQAERAQELERLQSDLVNLRSRITIAENEKTSRQREFDDFKRTTARLIAEELQLGRGYIATHLVNDYNSSTFGSSHLLDDATRAQHKAVISQNAPLPRLARLIDETVNLPEIISNIYLLMETTIGRIAIAELQAHPVMLQWIKEGVDYHTENRLSDCLFCGLTLSQERLSSLQGAIDDRFDRLVTEITNTRRQVATLRERLIAMPASIPSVNDLALEQQALFTVAAETLEQCISAGVVLLDEFASALERKASSPNLPLDPATFPDQTQASWYQTFITRLDALNNLLDAHNHSHDEFQEVQNNARSALKSHFLAEAQEEFVQKRQLFDTSQEALNGLKDEQANLERQIDIVQQAVQQHGPAAEVLNCMLEKYLGHSELQLFPLATGYEFRRNGNPIVGCLSEGEKTAVALCYFLCLLEAEGRNIGDLIVVVDDPISSLDTKALNYAFSLIKGQLSKALQVFIFTHNLAFMNECKKWLRPKTEAELLRTNTPEVADNRAKASLLYIESVQNREDRLRRSSIKVMPRLIREYESEYHYLFQMAHTFYQAESEESPYFYVMPNVLRKVLEIFLAFKVPGGSGLSSKVDNILADNDYSSNLDSTRIRALDRLIQVESHGDNLDDLVSFSSMTLEETTQAANALFNLIEMVDAKHYQKMCRLC